MVLILVAPTILLIVGVAVSSFLSSRHRRQCPACLQRGLKQVSFVRTEAVVKGETSPDYRTYLLCERCGSRFKLHDGILSGVPEDEMNEATRFG